MGEYELTRRRLVELGLALPPFAVLADAARAAETPLAATPAIADDHEPTQLDVG